MCGQKAIPHVVIVTTMWAYVPKEMGNKREEALRRDVWKDILGDGFSVVRFQDTYESAWNIVGNITRKEMAATLLIQEEMCNAGKLLSETKAGRNLKKASETVPAGLLSKIRRGFFR
jgi:hypothetical protein